MVSGGMLCIKFLLFAFNLCFAALGVVLIYAGFTTITNIGPYIELLEEGMPRAVSILLIAIGFLVFIIAFLGCCGAIKQHTCMLFTFSTVLLLLLVIELIGGGFIFVFRTGIQDAAQNEMLKYIDSYRENQNSSTANEVVDNVQELLHCCGAENSLDWINTDYWNQTSHYPSSCCPDIGDRFCTDIQLYAKGCVDALYDYLKNSIALLGGIAIGVALIQLIGIVFGCCLGRAIKKDRKSRTV